MKYQTISHTDLKASAIVLGTWGLGGGSVWSDEQPDEKTASALLDTAEQCGINYIDTAPVYGMGTSETLLGKALKGRRDKFILQSKVSLNWRNEEGGTFKYERDGYTVNNDTSAAAIRKDLEGSLLRLGTDHLDIAVVHYVNDSITPVQETMETLNELIKEGKIKAAALSNSKPQDYENYEKYGHISLVQEQFSLLAPYHGYEYFPHLQKDHSIFQVYGALEEGILTSRSYVQRTFAQGDIRARLPWSQEAEKTEYDQFFDLLEEMAAAHNCSIANLIEAWTLTQYPDISLLIGMRHPSTMLDTCHCLSLHLTKEETDAMEAAARSLQRKDLDK